MTIFLFSCKLGLLAQTASGSGLQTSASGGTATIVLFSLAAGYLTGLGIWREDRKRFHEADKVNKGLRSQIDEAQPRRSQ